MLNQKMENNSARRIIIIAFYFPPIGGAGAQRPTKFAKYLIELGWEVVVITPEIAERNSRWEPKDLSFEIDLEGEDGNFSVVRVANSTPSRKLLSIDWVENWALSAGQAALNLLKKRTFDAVLITMSPFSLVRAADVIRKETEAKILLDFRDPWAFDGWQPQKTYFHWWHQFREMKKAVFLADGVIANTVEAGSLIKKQFRDFDKNKLVVIENGYDPEDFSNLPNLSYSTTATDTFTLRFTGSLTTDTLSHNEGLRGRLKSLLAYTPEKIENSGRTLIHLLKAINLLISRDDPIGKLIRIECFGVDTEADRQSVRDAGLDEIVSFKGYLQHSESVKLIRSADGLFLPLHGLAPGNRSRITPGKTYEYLATGRPILGCLPQGDARDLIERYSFGSTADPCNPDQIALALKKIVNIQKEDSDENKLDDWISKYDRRNLTLRLVDFIDRLKKFD